MMVTVFSLGLTSIPAFADDDDDDRNRHDNDVTTCMGGSDTPLSGIHDNVIVPSGASCAILPDTLITGNLKVKRGGEVSSFGATIDGNVQSVGGVDIVIQGGTVGGDVQIKKSTGRVNVDGVSIGGYLKIKGSTGNLIDVFFNTVGGDLQLVKNRITLVPFISGNTIGGDLKCSKNSPAPSDAGTSNIVSGDAKGQCATFDKTICENNIPITGTHDNVIVPSGVFCLLSEAILTGDLIVESGASGVIVSDSIVGGDVKAKGVEGSVFLTGTPPGSGTAVGGDVTIKNSRLVRLIAASVDGDVLIKGSTNPAMNSDTVAIVGTEIGGDLKCVGNAPPVTVTLTTVGGEAKGQCATQNNEEDDDDDDNGDHGDDNNNDGSNSADSNSADSNSDDSNSADSNSKDSDSDD